MSDAANRHTSDIHIWPRNEGALRKKVTLCITGNTTLIMCGFMESLNHDFISLMEASLSLSMKITILGTRRVSRKMGAYHGGLHSS
jgi:hypothetical protein